MAIPKGSLDQVCQLQADTKRTRTATTTTVSTNLGVIQSCAEHVTVRGNQGLRTMGEGQWDKVPTQRTSDHYGGGGETNRMGRRVR